MYHEIIIGVPFLLLVALVVSSVLGLVLALRPVGVGRADESQTQAQAHPPAEVIHHPAPKGAVNASVVAPNLKRRGNNINTVRIIN